MRGIVIPSGLLAACLLASPLLAFADTPRRSTGAAVADPFASAPRLGGEDLTTVRAGQQQTTIYAAISDQTLAAENHGNTVAAGTINNGAINFNSGALQGFSGLGNFVINTGNNNTLQGSLSVTVLMVPATR